MCRIDYILDRKKQVHINGIKGLPSKFPLSLSFAFPTYPVAFFLLLIHICCRRRIQRHTSRSRASLVLISCFWICTPLNRNYPF